MSNKLFYRLGLEDLVEDAPADEPETLEEMAGESSPESDMLDFYWPAFAHLGEQAILNKEIYAGASSPNGIFGYAPGYEEYRQRESQVCGDFRSTFNYWHMGRIFASEPALNSDRKSVV